MYRYLPYEYVSKENGCKGVLYDDTMTIYDPSGNILYQVPWHCGEDFRSKAECRYRTETYPALLARLKELEEEIKSEFKIDE